MLLMTSLIHTSNGKITNKNTSKNDSKNQRDVILEIKDLVVEYPTDDGVIRAVDHVTLTINEGEVLGLVGESGCGKSTLGFALLNLLKGGYIKEGHINFRIDGRFTDLTKLDATEYQKIRGSKISMIFQASQNVLNPLQTVKDHFLDTLREHGYEDPKEEWKNIITLLKRLEIPESRLDDYPFQFSGGMQQRIVIALALMLNPKLVIADEPTTALDVLVQARILQLLSDLVEELSLTMIFISHDLGVVAEITQRVAIMYAGEIVEIGDTETIFTKPKHPYTVALLKAIPNIKDETKRKLNSIPGSPPDLSKPIIGCRFASRCTHAIETCFKESPKMLIFGVETTGKEHQVRCHMYDPRFTNHFNNEE